MANASRPVGLVTGASSGLGIDFATLLAKDGYDVVLVARSEAPMRETAASLQTQYGITAHVLPIDLSRPGAANAVAGMLDEHGLTVEVLVNNAGFGDNAAFAGADPHKITEMTLLNVTALTDLTRALLPGMIARRKGRIMLLGSTASFQPGPNMAVYCATKAYVLSFGEALAYELRGTGVSATTVCPGPTKTGFMKYAGVNEGSAMLRAGMMTSAEVARQGYTAMKHGTPVIVTGVSNLIGAAFGRYLPRPFVLPVAAHLMKK